MRKVYFETPFYVVYKEDGKLIGFEKEANVKKDDAFIYVHKLEENIVEETQQALFKIGIENIIERNSSVAIKVNLGGGISGILSSFTDPLIVKGIIRALKNIGAKPFVCEANMRSLTMNEKLLKKRGYHQILKEEDVPFINLSEQIPVEFHFQDVKEMVLLPEILLNPEVKIISAACPKHHWECGVTLSCKNMYGAIYERRKSIFHYNSETLDRVIAGCVRVMRPVLNILGARYLCAGLGPHFCIPIRFFALVISNCFLASDMFFCEILSYPFREVKHLMINAKEEISYKLLEDSYQIPEDVKNNIKKYAPKPKDTIFWRKFLALQYYVPHRFQYTVYPKLEFLATWINKLFFYPKGDKEDAER